MKINKFSLIIILGVLSLNIKTQAQNIFSITDYGYVPGSKENVIPALKEALKDASLTSSSVITFPKGRYDFLPTIPAPSVTKGFDLRGLKNLTIEGNDSEFIFHGWMQIADMDSCSNITMKNFSVDWERPYTSQAIIEDVTEEYLDLRIDKKKYPYTIEKDTLFFLGEGWKLPVINSYNNLFDKESKEIVYNTWDGPLGDIFRQKAEELPNGIVRLYCKTKTKPAKGNIVVLCHVRYAVTGIHIANSKDILLKNLTIYHALSNGVHCERTENITMDNASMKANTDKDRVFSTVADASHFTNCKGKIKVINCAHTGQGDDFINVRGTNSKILKIVNEYTVDVTNKAATIHTGDEVWFIDNKSAQRRETAIVASREEVFENGIFIGFRLSFKRPFSKSIKVGDFLENKTWNPEVEIRNCQILKKHRARGILVTTPKNVIIANNYFCTAGTAILIEGDLDYWFESGAHNNLKIFNNVFEDCLTSGNRDGSRWQWGDAVITITPSHRPESDNDEPYHKNINIYNNTFKVFDAPIVRARSVRNLSFTKNRIVKTYTYKPYTWQKSGFLLDGCRNVTVKGNYIDKNYKTTIIAIEHMKSKDVHTDVFTVKSVSGK